MQRTKRALILGTHSFIDSGSKVGIQHIAEGLARNGWQVDYVATSSSLFDLWGRQRHKRLQRVWLQEQDQVGVPVEQGLTEFAFKAIFPAQRFFLRAVWQLKTYEWLMPKWVRTREYDLCMHESSPNVIYFPLVHAKVRIFRLADWPDGFLHDLHPVLIKQFSRHIDSLAYDEIWAVSKPLADYALEINASNCVITMPNGVENFFQSLHVNLARKPKSAVFLGGLSAWVDLELVNSAAQQLPDWTFDVYGSGHVRGKVHEKNVHYHPPVPRLLVPELLKRYEVGLIPFKESSDRMRFVERPLKFYEYISAGLGVASTDVGSLRYGMGDLASYGNTPITFSEAIEQARKFGSLRSAETNKRFIQDNDWNSVISRVIDRLTKLLEKK